MDGEWLSGKSGKLSGEPKANPIRSSDEPDAHSPSTSPTYYSIYPVTFTAFVEMLLKYLVLEYFVFKYIIWEKTRANKNIVTTRRAKRFG